MAQFSLATLLVLVVMSACPGTSVPHIIGGGYNTKHYPSLLRFLNSLLKSALSDSPSSNIGTNLRESADAERESLTNQNQDNNVETEDNRSASYISADNQFIRVRLPPAVFSGMDQVNPFIRRKRQACQVTSGLTQTLSQMFSRLNSTTFLRRMPQTSELRIPANQPTTCPNNMNELSSSTEERLRSNCPWNLTRRDLGENSYPRHVAEAVCMCSNCIGSHINSCKDLFADVTHFVLQSCQDGIALMVKKTTQVRVGCFCASPAPNPTFARLNYD